MKYIVYADLESLIKKIDRCANNAKKILKKTGEHVCSGYSMSSICAFDHVENKYSLYLEEDCVKKFCTSLKYMLQM